MIRVSVLYPNSEGATFDMTYYQNQHMALVREKLGDKLARIEIDKPVGGMMPGQAPAHIGAGYLFFKDMADLQTGMGGAGSALADDIPNFTNTQPTIVIAEMVD